jgi:hypothetical protein
VCGILVFWGTGCIGEIGGVCVRAARRRDQDHKGVGTGMGSSKCNQAMAGLLKTRGLQGCEGGGKG